MSHHESGSRLVQQPLGWVTICLSLTQGYFPRPPTYFLSVGASLLLFCSIGSSWLSRRQQESSSSGNTGKTTTLLLISGLLMVAIASVRLLTSAEWHQLPMEMEDASVGSVLWDVVRGVFLGGIILLLQHSVREETNNHPSTKQQALPRSGSVLGGGAWENETNNDETTQIKVAATLAQTHPLFTIEEHMSVSETSRSSRINNGQTIVANNSDESLLREKDVIPSENNDQPLCQDDNLHPTKSFSSSSQSGSDSDTSSDHASEEFIDDEYSSSESSGSEPAAPGSEDDPLVAFRHFLSEDRVKLAQQEEQRKATKKTKDKKKRKKRGAKDKNGRTEVPSSSLQPPAPMFRNRPISGLDGSLCKTTSDVMSKQPPHEPSSLQTTAISSPKSKEPPLSKRKVEQGGEQPSVRFADENGQDIHVVHDVDSLYSFKRALVLLMLPKEHVFEFVGLEYNIDIDPNIMEDDKENEYGGAIRISQILQQLPSMASDPNMAKAQFVRLMRWHSNAERTSEMINALAIQSYDLRNDEVLVAVPQESSPQLIMESAKGVLQNQKLMRAVSEALWMVQM